MLYEPLLELLELHVSLTNELGHADVVVVLQVEQRF